MGQDKILIVEDEADIREMLEYKLGQEGYRTVAAADGEEGLEKARREAPDLLLLDLMLPGIDGLELCRTLRRDPLTEKLPIIMVTARGEESDIVTGLELGADDYVVKPFSPREMLARVRAVLRRRRGQGEDASGERLTMEGLVIDGARHEILVNDEPVDFTATEFRLLAFLARHPGRAFTRQQLLNRVIGDDAIVIDRNIDVHVRAIRKKLGGQRDRIETLRGVGYRFRRDER